MPLNNGAFRGVVDSYLAKLTPEQLALVRKFQQSGDNITDKPKAYQALLSLGLDQASTDRLLDMSYWVYSQPNREYGGQYRTPEDFAAGLGSEPGKSLLDQNTADIEAKRKIGADMEEKAKADKLAADLDAFARHMMDPLDMSDPTVQRIMQSATAQIGHGIYGAGAGGGMAQAAMAKGVTDAGSQLYQQRAALGASVMGNRLMDQRQLNAARDQANRMALNDQYENTLSQWEAGRGGAQQFGGILGAAVGSLPGIFTLNPGLAISGASAGYGVGAGIGGSTYGGPPSKPVYNSPYYGGGSMSGRMGY